MEQQRVVVDLSAKGTLNIGVLQKFYQNVLEIVEDASHTVIYNFSGGKWEKGEFEGACFLTRNNIQPYNSVIVLNKIGITNFKVELVDVMNLLQIGMLETPN